MERKRIIIIGGGFAGVKCARTLRRKLSPESCEIVLFSRENNMFFYPLHERQAVRWRFRMAARSHEKLEPVGAPSKSAQREEAADHTTNLNAIVLLADGLEHSVRSRNVGGRYSLMCPHGSRAMKKR
jgi:hypothetical protein